MVVATPAGEVWFDRRWKWHRAGIGVKAFKRKTKISDVLTHIAEYYRVSSWEAEMWRDYDEIGRTLGSDR